MKHITIRILLSALLVLILLPLTGCWSNKEIEDLGLIVGTSLDLEKQEGAREESAGQTGRYSNRDQITITNQFLTAETTGKGTKTGSSPQKAYNNVSETGDAILPTLRNMVLRIDKRAFAEHSKVIVIGEDLARTLDLQKMLDFFIREQEMRPSGLLLIAQNRASKTLESKKPMDIPAFQLVEMTHGHGRTTKILPPTTLTKIEGKLHSGASFLLQNVVSKNEETKFTGAAVIEGKTRKLRGFLNEKEIEGLTWITGKGKGGLVKSVDKKTGEPIIYEMLSMKSKIKPHVNGNNISFDIKIESEGRIAEHWVVSEKPMETDFLKRVEKTVEEEVERLVKNVLDKIQHEYRTDVAGFGNKLRIKYPHVWKNAKKDWDQTFSEVPIKYEVKITIKDYGTSDE
ncbi:Ger(x)C family spore germination protein [Paenibacillus sp. EZ-K15]|uniref:Ger(x)C family spore germination protein n=1 Tax=Paenibacillus sp. EZ-K15 TaxID=2044275 RepID=UPI000BF32A6E|nr:Ger(x)C family spore germination protein [Paenibacillus sp. EZ-K15]